MAMKKKLEGLNLQTEPKMYVAGQVIKNILNKK